MVTYSKCLHFNSEYQLWVLSSYLKAEINVFKKKKDLLSVLNERTNCAAAHSSVAVYISYRCNLKVPVSD